MDSLSKKNVVGTTVTVKKCLNNDEIRTSYCFSLARGSDIKYHLNKFCVIN